MVSIFFVLSVLLLILFLLLIFFRSCWARWQRATADLAALCRRADSAYMWFWCRSKFTNMIYVVVVGLGPPEPAARYPRHILVRAHNAGLPGARVVHAGLFLKTLKGIPLRT